MPREGTAPIRKRKVFYVMGFDPRGTPFYHAQLKREARISKKRGFSTLDVGPLEQSWAHGHECRCKASANRIDIDITYHFLSIIDIVAGYFELPLRRRIAASLILFARALLSPFWIKGALHAPKFSAFALYPYFVLMAGPALGIVAAIATRETTGSALLAVFASLLTLTASLVLIVRYEHRLFVLYLLGDFLFSCTAISVPGTALTERLSAFSSEISNALRASSEDEEILIVGHSSGALLAIQVAASVARISPPHLLSRLSLLTLGNQASLVYFPGTHGIRKDINAVVQANAIAWRDIFAPQDVISSGRFDFVEKLEIIKPKASGYHLHSARFKEALTPATYSRLRHSFLKLHMQYLRANETGRGFNYFAVLESSARLSKLHF